MDRQNRRRTILFGGFVALLLAGVVVLYVIAPPPTILIVRVFDDSQEVPLVGAHVEVQQPGQPPMPVVITDDTGTAQFKHPRPDPDYSIRVQKPDYAFLLQTGVSVPQSQETEVNLRLVPQQSGRLFVALNRARLVEIDTASLLGIQTIILPTPLDAPIRHVRLHPDQPLVYVAAGARTLILRTNGALLAQVDVGGTVDSLDVSRDGRYLLLTGTAQGDASAILSQRHVWTLDAHSGALIDDSQISHSELPPGGGLAWQPDGTDGDILYLTNHVLQSMPVRGQMALGLNQVPTPASHHPNKVILSPDEQHLYSWRQGWYSPDTGRFSDALLMISTVDGSVVYQEMSPGISALALSPDGNELYALNAKLGTLTLISLAGDRPQTVVPVGKQPQALAVSPDGQWAYVGDGQGQAIIVINLPSATIWHTISLPGEPLALAVRQG